MAAVPLFRETTMAAFTSHENTIYSGLDLERSIELQQILIIDHSTMTQHVILHSESLPHSVRTGENQEWLTFESHP